MDRHQFKILCNAFLLSICFSFCLTEASIAQSGNTLSYFLEAAEKNSPLLNDYNNQVAIAKIDSQKLRATYGFLVSADANGNYSPYYKGWGYDKALSNGQTLFAGLTTAKPLVSKENLNTRLASFQALALQVLAQKSITKIALINQVTSQYILAFSSQQYLEVSQEMISLLNQEDTILRTLTQKGVFKQTDYLAFKVTLQQNQLTWEQQKIDWTNNYSLLKFMSGLVNQDTPFLKPPGFEDQVVPKEFKESIFAKSLLADSLKLANDWQVIEFDYKPKVSAIASAGYQSSFILAPYKNWGFSVGMSLTFPLYDGHQKRMLQDQNHLLQQTRLKYKEQANRQYDEKIMQIEEQIRQYEKMKIIADEQIRYAQTLVEANSKQLPTGDIRMADFILSLNSLLSLKNNLILYNTNLLQLRNQLQNLILQ